MLDVKAFEMQSFLPQGYEDLAPELMSAQDKLQNGGGAGDDYIGWVNLPVDYDKEEFARIKAAAGEVAAGAGGVLQLLVSLHQLGSQCVLIGLGQEGLHIEQFDIQHGNRSFLMYSGT